MKIFIVICELLNVLEKNRHLFQLLFVTLQKQNLSYNGKKWLKSYKSYAGRKE